MTSDLIEQRLMELGRSKARLELVNRQLISLSTVAGLDNLVPHILDILMQTVGAANITVIFRLNNAWLLRDVYGTSRELDELHSPEAVEVFEKGKAIRFKDSGISVPYPGQAKDIVVENWVFPLISHERKIGVVCMDGMQLIHDDIFEELQPFFIYAGLMLDNEISNYSQLAEAHQRLQDSEILYRTLFDKSPDSIVLWSMPDLRMLQFNPVAHNSLGYTAEEFSQLQVADFEAVHSPEEILDVMEKVRLSGEVSFESTHKTKSGSLKPVSITLKKLEISGKPVILGTYRDITALKQAEAEQRKLEQQLLHAQKLESLGVLAGGIAHDFNNILMVIVGNADLALMQINNTSPIIDNLHQIEKAAARAADLAKQMLAYSGRGKFLIESLDLNSLLDEMLHMLQVSISKKAILRFDQHRPLPPVEADATQIRQVVMNLVINASEAIGEKSGVIAISTGCMECDLNYLRDIWLEETLMDGLYVYLEISDTGCGMDRETQGKLFDPFFTTKFTGRGLGMAAVLGIVRGHKGAIKVYSEPGKGTAFKILLPASGKPTDLFRFENSTDDWRGSGTVLLVDDEETVRSIGVVMLKKLGFTVVTANDGREALEVYKSTPGIRFVILDLTMPRMDGEQCFRELRQLKPDISVIISSGYSEQEVAHKFTGKGLAGFVQKPYKLSALKEAIRAIPLN